MTAQLNILLIQDTREQAGWGPLFSSPYMVQALPVGDYSVAGLENRIAVERKSLPDLLQCLTYHRERFERELARAESYDRFFVVVEASPSDILEHRYQAQVNPTAAWESICAFSVRHCPILFRENRRIAAKLTESILTKFAREFHKTCREMERAVKRFHKVS